MDRSSTTSAYLVTFLRPGDTSYPRPNPVPPMTPTSPTGNGYSPPILEKGMWEW